jgi:hypothetical protein
MEKILPHFGYHTTAAPNPNSGGLKRKGFEEGRPTRQWEGRRVV